MIVRDGKTLIIIDRAIFFFILIFVLSLSNSIFVNQIGYFGALLFVLLRFAIARENKFGKTGLEYAFIWFIAAEILSTIFSEYPSVALTNFLKRAVLIPMVYVTIASIQDLKRGRLVFNAYIAGTIVSVLIYIYYSYNYFINDLYRILQSGPSLFQFPITASEIISFTVIFLFAFLINEKTKLKTKLLILLSFAASVLALISTYKRTGWMGGAFGILIILIIKKQWKVLFAGVAVLAIIFMIESNISEIHVFNFNNEKLRQEYTFTTDGRAGQLYPLDEYYVISDYENGLSIYSDSVLIKNIIMPAPVTSFSYWKDSLFFAYLIDTRFVILKRDGLNFSEVNELLTTGYTISYTVANNSLYVLDSDSGLTVFRDPLDEQNQKRFRKFAGNFSVFVDSSIIIFGSNTSGMSAYLLEEGLPSAKIAEVKKSDLEYLFYYKGNILLCYPSGIDVYRYESKEVKLTNKVSTINNVRRIIRSDNGLNVIKKNGDIVGLTYTKNRNLELISNNNIGFSPSGAVLIKGKLYCSYVKRSRLLSILDPYIPSNFNRLALWRAGFKIFKDHILFGVGDIDLAEYYKMYKRDFDKEIQGHMHNTFIHVLVTLGLFGFFAVLFLFIKIIQIDLKIYRQMKSKPFVASYALGALAAFSGFLVSGLTEMNIWDQEITTLIWFTFGLNIVLYKLSLKSESKT